MLRVSMCVGAALALAGCGVEQPTDAAARSASKLLAAAAAQDRVALEAVIDRTAVREDLRRQMVAVGQLTGLTVDGGPSDFALDRMIGPAALVRAAASVALTTPTPDQLLPLMRTLDRQHVCLPDRTDPQMCVFTFAKAPGGWRLVGMRAMDLAPPAIGD